jgi:alkylation response protein AidB-like acyl-CoA dehydrogenase
MGLEEFRVDTRVWPATPRKRRGIFLPARAASINSGSQEIQRNVIAKRALGLPD